MIDPTDSPFSAHPNYDPATDAAVATWVLATKRRDWASMTEAEHGRAYIEYFLLSIDDDDLPT